MSDNGVLHQTTTRYTPEQNGAAERLNRTVMERVRAMLEDSGLPKELWAEAAVTACYIRNCSPVTGRDKTPWELFLDKAPDICNMRIIRAQAHALIPKKLRRKPDNQSEIDQSVGFPANTKGYRVARALPSGKVIISVDVIFAEEVERYQTSLESLRSSRSSWALPRRLELSHLILATTTHQVMMQTRVMVMTPLPLPLPGRSGR